MAEPASSSKGNGDGGHGTLNFAVRDTTMHSLTGIKVNGRPRREATELFHPVMLGLTQLKGSLRLEAWIGCGSQANKRTKPDCERSGDDPP